VKNFLEKFIGNGKAELSKKITDEEEQLKRQTQALFGLLSNLFGPDKIVLKAGKLEALNLMRSEVLGEKVVALQKIVFEDPTIEKVPTLEEIPAILDEVEEELADVIARRSVEDKLEKKISEKMQQRHEEYVKEIKMQLLKENSDSENPQTLKKLSNLEKLEAISLAKSAMEVLRPSNLKEVVGQEGAVKALISKLASPFPQHIILYGPPGVGKTTVARLALEQIKRLNTSIFDPKAPFVEVDGTTLRWDPRDITNPLLGSVHDPIYQGARKDLADGGVPEPKLGLVTEAHGGILFIDEIGELDYLLQNKLLKVLEDKRVTFDSAYYDPDDPNVPKYIKKIFEEGAPADFILIGATTKQPSDINPAIRSRCAEVYFDPLGPADIKEIVRNAGQKLKISLDSEVIETISEYTIEGRKAINLLADAYGLALFNFQSRNYKKDKLSIGVAEINEVIQISRLSPYVTAKGQDLGEVGKVFGLGVSGFLGSVIEIEAIAFPAQKEGQGSIRFNETAGSMAKDSVFNAASVVRKVTGQNLSNFDLHINVVGGGQIDGPSAGTAITLAIISAIENKPISQNIAITGEISIQGKVKAVGGVPEKIYGAKQAGVKKVIAPKENAKDIPQQLKNIEVITVDSIEEALEHTFVGGYSHEQLVIR